MSRADARLARAPAEAGLTLIEMLVVLAIIGVVSGATMLSLAPARSIGVEVEARRLAVALQGAADAALVADAPVVLAADAAGYSLGKARHELPEGMRLAGVPAAPLVVGEVPLDLTIARGGDAWSVRFDGLRATAFRP